MFKIINSEQESHIIITFSNESNKLVSKATLFSRPDQNVDLIRYLFYESMIQINKDSVLTDLWFEMQDKIVVYK